MICKRIWVMLLYSRLLWLASQLKSKFCTIVWFWNFFCFYSHFCFCNLCSFWITIRTCLFWDFSVLTHFLIASIFLVALTTNFSKLLILLPRVERVLNMWGLLMGIYILSEIGNNIGQLIPTQPSISHGEIRFPIKLEVWFPNHLGSSNLGCNLIWH